MQFTELLEQIRNHYVRRLLEAVTQRRQGTDAMVIHEAALRDEEGEIIRSGPLEIPLRVDLVEVRGDEIVGSDNVDTDDMLEFAPFTFGWPGEGTQELTVTVEPFQWNWLQLQTTGQPSTEQWHALRNWYLKWFGEDDPSGDQVAGAVHFCDDPHIEGSLIQLSLDLGTAPVECFVEMLDTLTEFGTSSVTIGQFDQVEEVESVD